MRDGPHDLIWRAIQDAVGDLEPATNADAHNMVFRRKGAKRAIAVRFGRTWPAIVAAAPERQLEIAAQVARTVHNQLASFEDRPGDAFVVELDDRVLDE